MSFLHLLYKLCLIAFIVSYVYCAATNSNNDLSLQTFTSRGEISQVSYAHKKIEKGLPCMAWHDKNYDVVILISILNIGSDVRVQCNYNSYITGDGIVAVAAGYSADCSSFFKFLNTVIQTEKETFGCTPSLNKINHSLAKWLTRGLYGSPDDDDSNQSKRMEEVRRPFASSAFIAKYDAYLKSLRLSYVENSGMHQDCEFGCFGKISQNTLLQIKQYVFSKDFNHIPIKQRILNVLKLLTEYFDLTSESSQSDTAFEVIVVKQSDNIEKYIVSSASLFDIHNKLKNTSS